MSEPHARILVIEDAANDIRLLGTLLSQQGYGVTVARSGEEGLEQVALEVPNLVLLDVILPGISGYDVCRSLRAAPATRHVPILMITALQPDSDRQRGLDAGADDFLTKPLDRNQLAMRLAVAGRLHALRARVLELERE